MTGDNRDLFVEFAEPDDVRRVVAEHGDAGTEGLLQAVNEHRKVLKEKHRG